jgi:hypothetical protein
MRSRPVVIASSDSRVQDLYVRALRDRRINALGVDACDDLFVIANAARISTVVIDVVTPDDWLCYEEIRCADSMNGIRCIVLGDVVAEDRFCRHMSRALGCDAFLARTAAIEDVLATIQRVGTTRNAIAAE